MTQSRRICLLVLLFATVEGLLLLYVDRPLSLFVRGLEASHPDVISFFHAYTDLAKSKWYLWPSGIAVIGCALWLRVGKLKEDRHEKLALIGHKLAFFFSSIALSGILTDTIKPIIGRARPVELLRKNLFGFRPFTFEAAWNAMPSGHATTAAALATALILLFPRWRAAWVLLGFVLAVSRIMVNAHYFSDVLAGSLVGALTALLLWRTQTKKGMFPLISGIFPIDKPASNT